MVQNPSVDAPIVTLGNMTFMWVRHADVYVVAATVSNANPTLVFEFLYKFLRTAGSYLGGHLSQEAVKKNFMLLYELLDEMMDFGYPQDTELNSLKMMITSEMVRGGGDAPHPERTYPMPSSVAAPTWRKRDIKYRKNKCFIDVIETLHLLISAQGTVLRADVDGRVQMRSYLSGMPDCTVGVNAIVDGTTASGPALVLDKCQFHPCVKIGHVGQEQCLRFIPPDGEFELMRYRAVKNIRVPLLLDVVVEETAQRMVRYNIQLRASMDPQLVASDVEIRIPTPPASVHVDCHAQIGQAKWEGPEAGMVWRIPRIQGMVEVSFRAEVKCRPTQSWTRPPIVINFDVLMLAVSGFLIRYLQVVERSNYRPVKWVRYQTRAAHSYLVRF